MEETRYKLCLWDKGEDPFGEVYCPINLPVGQVINMEYEGASDLEGTVTEVVYNLCSNTFWIYVDFDLTENDYLCMKEYREADEKATRENFCKTVNSKLGFEWATPIKK